MTTKFTDPRLSSLNGDGGFVDTGMRRALVEALEPGEVAIASYSVSAHIWVEAVLTQRALLLVKGAVRARVTRVPLPLEVTRTPAGTRKGVRVRTPLGVKTLWGSKLDGDGRLLLAVAASSDEDVVASSDEDVAAAGTDPAPEPSHPMEDDGPAPRTPSARQERRQARRAAGPRPRRPRRRRVRRERVGFPPPATIWDLADNCVKCGRPLTDPRSRRARVGTKCIRIYGSQQRRIPNLDRARWSDRKTRADVAYVDAKVRADAEFARARAAYDEARREWERARAAR